VRDISGAEQLLLETLGLSFLSFVLNAAPEKIASRLSEEARARANGRDWRCRCPSALELSDRPDSDGPHGCAHLIWPHLGG